MRTLLRRSRQLFTARRSFVVGALLSCAVGMAFFATTSNMIEKDAGERFVSVVRTAHYTILRRVKSYADVLRSSASLFQAEPDLTRAQFHRYVQGLNLETDFPGVETINYAMRVMDADRPAYERRMAEELAPRGITNFKIQPPGRATEYLLVTYIEPEKIGLSRFGVDLLRSGAGQPTRLLDSRDTGGVSASGIPVRLPNSITGLNMRLPVYRAGMPTTTLAERRAAYVGSIGIAFNVERLMGGVIAELPVSGMHTTLIGLLDPVKPGAKQKRLLLYDSKTRPGTRTIDVEPVGDDEFGLTLPVEFNQRSWEVGFRIKKASMMSPLDVMAPWMAALAGFVSTALLYALFHTLATSRGHAIRLAEEMTKELRSSEANLQRSNAKLRELAAHAENIKESERKRIAREIHDDLGQNLLALRIEADLLATRTGDRHPLLHERARRTLLQIDTTIRSVRQIINDLRPNVLDLGLNAAVDWQIAQFTRRTGIPCELAENDCDIKVTDQCATALFRILQESLTNISRHANATRVRVELQVNPPWISMTVIDNGCGLQVGARPKPGSFGLVGIEERVKIQGGVFRVTSIPGAGTTINVSLPLDEPSSTPPLVEDNTSTRAEPSTSVAM